MIKQDHQNPEYGTTNYVYVRVRNRSCEAPGDGTVKLYWAKASIALGWPAPWDGSVTVPAIMGGQIGVKPVTVNGRGQQILEFAWTPPNPEDYASFGADNVHFCLLSRIETNPVAPYGMAFPEGNDLGQNVKNNNKIAWKNVTIVDEEENGWKVGYIVVGQQPRYRPGVMRLEFTGVQEKFEPRPHIMTHVPEPNALLVPRSLSEWGTVVVDMHKSLFKRWQEGQGAGNGIKAPGRSRSFELLKPNAWIDMMQVKPEEQYTSE